jgi:hypothetical protein
MTDVFDGDSASRYIQKLKSSFTINDHSSKNGIQKVQPIALTISV